MLIGCCDHKNKLFNFSIARYSHLLKGMTNYPPRRATSITWNDSCGLACNTFWLLLLHFTSTFSCFWVKAHPYFSPRNGLSQRGNSKTTTRHSNLQNIPHTFCWRGHRITQLTGAWRWTFPIGVPIGWTSCARADLHQCIYCVCAAARHACPPACPPAGETPQACSAVRVSAAPLVGGAKVTAVPPQARPPAAPYPHPRRAPRRGRRGFATLAAPDQGLRTSPRLRVLGEREAGVELCAVVARTWFPTLSGNFPSAHPFANCPGPVLGWHASPRHSQTGSSPSSRAPPRRQGAGGGPAAGVREAEEKGRRGVRSSRQREQQIAPSQWQRQDEVAPNSLRPMTRQSLQKPISISPRAGQSRGLRRPNRGVSCSIQFSLLLPQRASELCLLPSPPLRISGEPALRAAPLLAANKRGLRKYETQSPAASASL